MKKFLAIITGFCMFVLGPLFALAQATDLTGAGATFPYPLYSKMFEVYHQQTSVAVNYQSIGSGGGQRQLLNKTVDFGASDAFMSDEQLSQAPAKILHIPTCLGEVVLSYNLPGNPTVKLSPEVIANIFLGKITAWNDPEIKKLNPGLSLPSTNIITVHRSDGSGTTGIFTHYLSTTVQAWKEKVGEGLSVNWPNGLGAKGNPGVAGIIQQTPGSIGYVELIYALQNKMPMAVLKNMKGNFIKPSLESASIAGNASLPADTRAFVTNTDAPKGYPLSGFTWLLVYKEQHYGERSKEKAEALVRLLWWMTHDGQKLTKSLDYAPLPPKAVKQANKIISEITFDGKSILAGEK